MSGQRSLEAKENNLCMYLHVGLIFHLYKLWHTSEIKSVMDGFCQTRTCPVQDPSHQHFTRLVGDGSLSYDHLPNRRILSNLQKLRFHSELNISSILLEAFLIHRVTQDSKGVVPMFQGTSELLAKA